jgi:hypothetical protein
MGVLSYGTSGISAATTDYALCAGMDNIADGRFPYHPRAYRGAFMIARASHRGVMPAHFRDGLSSTFAMGEAAGGNERYRFRAPDQNRRRRSGRQRESVISTRRLTFRLVSTRAPRGRAKNGHHR